ncbi:hypothetical protein R6Q57_001292 [Mikania cordata]
MPNINTSVDDLLLKSDQRFDFTTCFSKPVPLTTDPVEIGHNISDDSEECADSLNDTGLRGKNEERSDGRSIKCSTSFRTSPFIPKTDFVGRFDEIKIKPNEMCKNFNSTFVKNDVILESISFSLHQEYKGHSTITKEAGTHRCTRWPTRNPMAVRDGWVGDLNPEIHRGTLRGSWTLSAVRDAVQSTKSLFNQDNNAYTTSYHHFLRFYTPHSTIFIFYTLLKPLSSIRGHFEAQT